jgi:chromatin assembly factor 1 subunit A
LPIGAGPKAVKPKRTIPNDQLPAFKAEVEGQDHTKIGMIEVLKKKFPEFPKDAITNTLTMVAKRVGGSEKDKRWVLIP